MAQDALGAMFGLALFSALATATATASRAETPPGVTVRLIRPDQQWERVIALFQGTRAPHPAAALADWKRATAPLGGFGKPLEAAIAAFNPQMVGELRGLDQAEVVLSFDPVDGALQWHALLPHDDGTFAALAPALALTDGGIDPPIDGRAVDRLGPPGAPVMAHAPGGLTLAGSRDALAAALARDRPRPRARAEVPGFAPPDSGTIVKVDPEGLGRSGPILRRRLAEAIRALGCRSVDAVAGLEAETLSLSVTMPLAPPLLSSASIDPAWLDGLPAEGLVGAFAWAVVPGEEALARAFLLADCVERADPAHADVAPLRTRINLLAATVRVRPEVDLWPHLRGLSAALLADPEGRISGALVALHTDGIESAAQIAGQVLPRLAPLLGLRPEPAGTPDRPRLLGRLRDRPLYLDQQGATLRLGWGEPSVAPLLEAGRNPSRSIGPTLRALALREEVPPQRFGAFWPGRLALAPIVGEPLARTIAEAPPVVWSGKLEPSRASDLVSWTGLRDGVRRFLDRIPLEPPPERSPFRHAPD